MLAVELLSTSVPSTSSAGMPMCASSNDTVLHLDPRFALVAKAVRSHDPMPHSQHISPRTCSMSASSLLKVFLAPLHRRLLRRAEKRLFEYVRLLVYAKHLGNAPVKRRKGSVQKHWRHLSSHEIMHIIQETDF